ncbi:ROK family protein, partial [Variovorax sp. 2RAF20]
SGTILTAPNLGWTGLALQQLLASRTGLPVIVANDANAARRVQIGHRAFGKKPGRCDDRRAPRWEVDFPKVELDEAGQRG